MNDDIVMRILPVAGLIAVFILVVTWIGRRRRTASVLSPDAPWLADGQDGPLLSAYDGQSFATIAQTVIGGL